MTPKPPRPRSNREVCCFMAAHDTRFDVAMARQFARTAVMPPKTWMGHVAADTGQAINSEGRCSLALAGDPRFHILELAGNGGSEQPIPLLGHQDLILDAHAESL